MHTAIGLIALALGYKVFVEAGKEKEGLKILGQVIGVFVMVLAFAATLCGAMKCISGDGCPLTGKHLCSMGDREESAEGSKMCPVAHKPASE